MKQRKVALVYDRVNKIGGAERVLLALHEIWPHAPLYTAVYDKKRATWANDFLVRSSFIQRIPFAKNHHELFPWLTPMAFESFSFDDFDIVISVTSAEAKNIITKPHTLHICYCLTPTRYLWSGNEDYQNNPNIGLPNWITSLGLRLWKKRLQYWDRIASARPDYYLAISSLVGTRIQEYYKRKVEKVIYPPVETDIFLKNTQPIKPGSYFLVVSRLVPYKRVDIIIDACNKTGLPLVIVGDGVELLRLMRMARKNIQFKQHVSDQELVNLYRQCKAYISAAQEDFGISAVEAQAAGKPVISYKKSGIAEIIVEGKTGMLFAEQTTGSLVTALKSFDSGWYDSVLCATNAQRFSKSHFMRTMKDTVEQLYNTYI
jgi:glycosyltransferase involved in cell wall biosynthesis